MPFYVYIFCIFFMIPTSAYLVIAVRHRVLSMIFLMLAVDIWLLYAISFDILPASYKHYLWAGSLSIGPFVFRPGYKPNFEWVILFLVLLSLVVSFRQKVKKRKPVKKDA